MLFKIISVYVHFNFEYTKQVIFDKKDAIPI